MLSITGCSAHAGRWYERYSTVLNGAQQYSTYSAAFKSTQEYSRVLRGTRWYQRLSSGAGCCAGPDLHADGLEYMHNNKWQNGAVSRTK
jgi:hypothetical protein